MGGDGGVIANDRRFLRGCLEEKPNNSADVIPQNIKETQWLRTQFCAYSQDRLLEPIVACRLGNLYNKEAILTAICNKCILPGFSHITGLRDLVTLRFTKNPSFSDDIQKSSKESRISKYICPISQTEFNGMNPFFVIWTTGHVISGLALKSMGIDALQADFGPFGQDDLVKLIPLESELPVIITKLQELIEKRQEKKAKKKRKHEELSDHGDPLPNDTLKSSRKEKSISLAKSVVNNVSTIIDNQKSSSAVYSSLFHNDGDADKKDKDLFIAVAGLRYSLR